ncbi:MAG: hypothetical protein IKG95_07285 [Bacteroidales bacterium]|nr:hypothetical protein [Bacteroidales bacterium]
MLEITVKKNPFIETLVSKEELFADFAEFATRKKELGQNAMLAYYGLCHGEAIMKFCDGKVDDLMKHASIPKTSIAYFQAGFNAWKNLYEGLTMLPESSIYTLNHKNKTVDELKNLPLQQIFYGAPGTGKSHEVKKLTKGKSVIRTTFHPDSDYSTFVGSYKPTMTKKEVRVVPVVVNNGISLNQNQGTYTETQIMYRFVIQAFLKAYLKAWKQYADGKRESVSSYIIEETQPQKKQKNKDITVKVDRVVLVSNTSMADAGRQILAKYIELVKANKSVDEIIKEWNDSMALGGLFKLTRVENTTSNWEKFLVINEDCYFYAGINGKDWPSFCERVKELFNSSGHQIEIIKATSPSQTTNDAVFNDDIPTLFAESSMASDEDNYETTTLNPVFLIIEEINRGNCAQIFGDLFQLLDRNGNGFSEYPIEADTDLQQEIERAFTEPGEYHLDNDINVEGVVENYTSNYNASLSKDIQHGRILLLPSNLYIWATMNTSDQSLFPIDSAFKRRWEWKYVPIVQGYDKNTGTMLDWDIKVDNKTYNWWKFLQAINKHIGDITKSEDKKLGFFFCKATNGTISAETFVSKVLFYLWNDVYKDYDYSPAFFRDENKRLIEFSEYYEQDSNNNTVPNDKLIQAFIEKVEPSFKTAATDANPD